MAFARLSIPGEEPMTQTIEQEYEAARPKSKALYERAKAMMPSGAAHDGRVFSPFPFYVSRADGAYKWDVDGHRYIDGWSGHGSIILGHNHPAVLKAILEQAPKGTHWSAGSEIELRWAELIRSIVPGAERVRFMMTGTETTALAIRIRSEEHTSELQSRGHLVCRLLLEKKKRRMSVPDDEDEDDGPRYEW